VDTKQIVVSSRIRPKWMGHLLRR